MTSTTRHSPNVRDVRAPSQIFEEGVLSKSSFERMDSNKENEGKEAIETVEEVGQDESEEAMRLENGHEVTKERRLRDEESALQAAEIRVGMMV